MKNNVKNKLNHALKITCQGLWYLTVALLLLVLVSVSVAKLRHEVPQIAGYSVFRITTGSMEPTIPTGTYILTRKTPAEDIAPGQIITFYSEDPAIAGMPNTHRVVKVAEGEPRSFVTRGDANLINDELTVKEDQIIGRYVCSLTRITAFVNFFMRKFVLIAMLVVQGICVVLMLVTVKRKRPKAEEKEESQ